MDLSRRSFLKVSGAATAGAALGSLGFDLSTLPAQATPLRINYARETTTVCPYCSCGCSIIVHTVDGKVVNTEGDPDSPINEGALCSKGSALYQESHNEHRLSKVRYRAPGSSDWEEKDWDWALDRITRLVKEARDTGFVTQTPDGLTVNRTEAIANLGGAGLNNEECYVLAKFARGLGIVNIDHQARI
jgi:formate dehydrogenase major subunit